ncbi:MAG: hypothetical protein FJ198_07935 [Gammaproteobacteria bacterium]|nr:hypothetical protein [Gammaproteobacteria bacterium]MBM4233803.1 hypothetical protein [Gammaproteobacteria bacterium]
MLALGANGVLLGRAWAYALGAAGGQAVHRLFEIMEAQICVAMALSGVTRTDQIDRRILAP